MLKRVTITGADDGTDVNWMVALSKAYPFVEWGVLCSASQEGSSRFPSRAWVNRLLNAPGAGELQLSTHLCGRWVRELLIGTLRWKEVPVVAQWSHRLQINTHGQIHQMARQMISKMHGTRQYIVQWDGVNDHLAYTLKSFGINTAILYDKSGGAGVLPERWPSQNPSFFCGYAGGLGPDNVVENIRKIKGMGPDAFWIDMERRVRTEDDSRLDEKKVEFVLEQCKYLVSRRAVAV